MFKSINQIASQESSYLTYEIVDSDFVDIISVQENQIPPSMYKVAAIVLMYEKQKQPVCPNLALFLKLNEMNPAYRNITFSLSYLFCGMRYVNDIEKYLLLV
jgi:hypothetical protein